MCTKYDYIAKTALSLEPVGLTDLCFTCDACDSGQEFTSIPHDMRAKTHADEMEIAVKHAGIEVEEAG